MQKQTTPVDPAIVQARLRQLLHALLVQNSDCAFETPDVIPDDADLSSLGITSIDFLEFALAVEQEFRVAILETVDPNDLPHTLQMWQQQVCARLAH